jgi:NAD(P)-dependent dehydrogenase (short-subunit alcohol dehydrogenase family)
VADGRRAETAGNGARGSFTGKLAAVTGGGSGMGRELVRQLAAQGCSVAACDWHADTVAETAVLARAGVPHGVRVTSHACDVGDEGQVLRFRDELLETHGSDHVDLVFSNAGIGGGASFVSDSRQEWERTFTVDWWGVYYCARVFLPLLIRLLGFCELTPVRRISYEDALAFERVHETEYLRLGFELVDIPPGPVHQRAALIDAHLRSWA